MKSNKKALLAYAEQNGWKYPKLYVWSGFNIFGGLIGGLIFGIYLMFIEYTTFADNFNFLSATKDFLISGIAGIFVGFLPASLTGLYTSLRKIVQINKINYLELFVIGCLITVIFGISWLFYDNKDNVLKDFYFYLSAMILGGLSSVICGKLFLPKLPNNF